MDSKVQVWPKGYNTSLITAATVPCYLLIPLDKYSLFHTSLILSFLGMQAKSEWHNPGAAREVVR